MLTEPDFDNDKQTKEQLQKTISPFYKWVMFFIGMGTIVFGMFTFLHYTSKFGDSPFVWMVLTVFLGAIVIFFGFKPFYIRNKKILVSCVLAGLNFFIFTVFYFLILQGKAMSPGLTLFVSFWLLFL